MSDSIRTYSESTAAKVLGFNRPKLVNLRKSGALAKGVVFDESKTDEYGAVSQTAPILYSADKVDAIAKTKKGLLAEPAPARPKPHTPIAVVHQRDAHLTQRAR